MKWFKAIAYGAVLFSLMFVFGSIVMFGLKLSGTVLEIVMFTALIIFLWSLARHIDIRSIKTGVKVGLVWLIIYALLDYFVVVQIFGEGDTSYYYHWRLYLWYALIVVIPGLVGHIKRT